MAARDTTFINGAARLSQRIRTIRERLAVGPMVEEIGELLLARTERRFDQEVDPDGKKWTPLAPATIAIKRRLGYGSKGKLKRTETLRHSLQLVKGNVSGALYTNTGAGVRIGVKAGKVADYGRVQNYGSGKIPARRFLGIGALDVKSVDSFMRRRADSAME